MSCIIRSQQHVFCQAILSDELFQHFPVSSLPTIVKDNYSIQSLVGQSQIASLRYYKIFVFFLISKILHWLFLLYITTINFELTTHQRTTTLRVILQVTIHGSQFHGQWDYWRSWTKDHHLTRISGLTCRGGARGGGGGAGGYHGRRVGGWHPRPYICIRRKKLIK